MTALMAGSWLRRCGVRIVEVTLPAAQSGSTWINSPLSIEAADMASGREAMPSPAAAALNSTNDSSAASLAFGVT